MAKCKDVTTWTLEQEVTAVPTSTDPPASASSASSSKKAAAVVERRTTIISTPPASQQQQQQQQQQQHHDASFQILVSRIPSSFDETSVHRLLEERLGPGSVRHVALAYEKKDPVSGVVPHEPLSHPPPPSRTQPERPVHHHGDDDRFYRPHRDKTKTKQQQQQPVKNVSIRDEDAAANNNKEEEEQLPHRGFGFATLQTVDLVQQAISQVQTIRGGAKVTSTRKYTLYLGPCLTKDSNNKDDGKKPQKHICFLFAKQGRCPYGDQCRFVHDRVSSTVVSSPTTTNQADDAASSPPQHPKKIKCRDHRKNKCQLGDACPFSHDFEPSSARRSSSNNTEATITTKTAGILQNRLDSEKDCINWKTKGQCRRLRKGTLCPYRHDPVVQQAALDKIKKKKRTHEKLSSGKDTSNRKEKCQQQEPTHSTTTIRVFGLNYTTQEEDVRQLLSECGLIVSIDFPTTDGPTTRNKGYCGITFANTDAVDKAILLSGTELHGRWLEIQAGRMLLEHWEQQQQYGRYNKTQSKRQKKEKGHRMQR